MKLLLFALPLALTVSSVVHAEPSTDPIRLANPLVGTSMYDGAMYPGAALPWGMVKLSPDTTKPSTAGYNPDQPILGFSHTHIGGTGGGAFGGQVRVRPQTGPLDVSPPPAAKEHETASPGYYAVDLAKDHIHAELTLTERAGFHRYIFPTGAPGRVLVDISAFINNGSAQKPSGHCTGSSARFVSDREIEGSSGIAANNATYTVYFVAVFDQVPSGHGVWTETSAQPGATTVQGLENQAAGFYGEFDPKGPVGLRVGISYTSIELARKNLHGAEKLNFDQVRARAERIWTDHFSTVAVEGGTDTQRRQFYTAMYHTVLAPTDVTGDNGGWSNDPKQSVYWDIYTLWDTFRTANPLLTLIHPDRESGIIRSLLAVYQKRGWLPDAWVYSKQGIAFQGGTHADNIIADAFVKNLGGFDRELAYAAVMKNAGTPSRGSKIFPGEGRLEPYFTLGYVPSVINIGKTADGRENEYSAGVSRTIEYAYNDFSAAEIAEALGHKEEAEKLRRRSLGAYILFHPGKKYFWGKTASGEWMPDADPTLVSSGWKSAFYEGNAWQYRFSMPHDMQGLIARYGGSQAFLMTLDEYFDKNYHRQGNEPSFLNPWLYGYVGRPDKNVDRVRAIMAKDFKLAPAGYPGDEDAGAMSAWYIFAAMGFYPVAGQDVYLLASPVFSKISVKLGSTGKIFVISSPGLSPENRYIQSATLNGKPLEQAWFRHGDIINGAELVLQMGPKPSVWGTKVPPPSLTP